jgi:hypothetical protein
MQGVSELLGEWGEYRSARTRLLAALDLPQSCRDPLSEFSEGLVAGLLGGELASNRVQKGWDVQASIGRVQVKYLANSSQGSWVNWHVVEPTGDMDWWALVVFLDLMPVAVHAFPSGDLTPFCEALGKRHGNQSTTLQFTKTNHRDICADPEKYRALGMKVFLLDAV